MSKQTSRSPLELGRNLIGWSHASNEARNWWKQLEKVNLGRSDLVVELAEELAKRSATVDDFFLVCAYSGREGVRENLSYLDLVWQDESPDTNVEASRTPVVH